MSEWVKCSERLPDDGAEVLTYRNEHLDVLYHEDASWHHPLGWPVRPAPTHWMDLPEPPQ